MIEIVGAQPREKSIFASACRELTEALRLQRGESARLQQNISDLAAQVQKLERWLDPGRPEQPPNWTSLEMAKCKSIGIQTKVQKRNVSFQTPRNWMTQVILTFYLKYSDPLCFHINYEN